MRKNVLLLFAFFAMFSLSCSDDNKNEPNPISPPEISGLKSEYFVMYGKSLKLSPMVKNGDGAVYRWLIDDKEVAATPEYNFKASVQGKYVITLKVTNKQGTASKTITILVKNIDVKAEISEFTILKLKIPNFVADKEKMQFKMLEAPSELYRISCAHVNADSIMFVAGKEGEYVINLTYGTFETTMGITVVKPKKAQSPYTAKVFEYLPAPGQFVNELPKYVKGDTRESMRKKAEEWICGDEAYMITLGGWGGYVTIGFDHTIINVAGKCDFRINGNAFGAALGRPGAPFGGSCEPGIVMVAYDRNKNGKPDDDEWYEIKGSGNFSAEKEPWYSIAKENGNDVRVFRDYEMTYYKPTKETPEEPAKPDNPKAYVTIKNYIRWKDNKNNSGYKVKNVYHKQTYYPAWVEEDKLTYKGIRLPENGINEGKFVPGINPGDVYFVLYGFRYGYVDNRLNTGDDSAIDIDWAIDKKGNKVHLPGIDFVKVYSGVNQENGWLGECSTEVERGEDLHMLGKNIKTIEE